MNIILILITGGIGLCLGSFVNLIISRYSPSQTTYQFLVTIIFKRSYCPQCKHNLTGFSLIPVISWLIQGGKCRFCQTSIAIHYPAMEMLFAIINIFIITYYGINLWSIMLILLTMIFIILIIIDYRYLILPNCFNYLILILGLISSTFGITQIVLYDAWMGIVLGMILLGVPSVIYYLITKRIGLGGGDIKLLAALGTWVNYHYLPILLIIACMIGLILFAIHKHPYLTKFKTHTVNKSKVIPFGPCLIIAAYCLLLS